MKNKLLLIFIFLLSFPSYSQEDLDLDLAEIEAELNKNDEKQIKNEGNKESENVESEIDELEKELLVDDKTEEKKTETEVEKTSELPPIENIDVEMSNKEVVDDLESLKEDFGEVISEDEIEKDLNNQKTEKEQEISLEKPKIIDGKYEIGKEEKDLLELASKLGNKLKDDEWNEIAGDQKEKKYIVSDGDWLWKISKKLFGSGFYYSKIWALNPYIKNPHLIEPGMVLIFDTGDEMNLPQVRVGSNDQKNLNDGSLNLNAFGEGVQSNWLQERSELIKNGKFFQNISDYTYEDLVKLSSKSLNREFEKYVPPIPDIIVKEPDESTYDKTGFDKTSKIQFTFKEGFFLNTFVSSNFVQDLGEVVASENEKNFFSIKDNLYVKFNSEVRPVPGDMFSIYSPGGKVNHKNSDRSGNKFTITAQVKILRKVGGLWEVQIEEATGVVHRGNRLTVYTPKISKIYKTFNKRKIEGVILADYEEKSILYNGDVVYIDRGRADGVELGNVFEAYGFTDKYSQKKITTEPTYKIGEVTVITLADNFSTGLVTNSSQELSLGGLLISKSVESALLDKKKYSKGKKLKDISNKDLESLDVELDLGDVNNEILKKAGEVQLTDDELKELERKERENTIIDEHEKDILELEKLEAEVEAAEEKINQVRIDEDRYLEQQNLENIEDKITSGEPADMDSLELAEDKFGKKYMDEDINEKENPYGLTEFDLEEVDELLNNP